MGGLSDLVRPIHYTAAFSDYVAAVIVTSDPRIKDIVGDFKVYDISTVAGFCEMEEDTLLSEEVRVIVRALSAGEGCRVIRTQNQLSVDRMDTLIESIHEKLKLTRMQSNTGNALGHLVAERPRKSG